MPKDELTFVDEFNGNDRKLLGSIDALLKLDADGALVPHGIGGHARTLLNAAAARLQIDGDLFRCLRKKLSEEDTRHAQG